MESIEKEELKLTIKRKHLRRQETGEAKLQLKTNIEVARCSSETKSVPSKFTIINLDTLDQSSEVVEAFA